MKQKIITVELDNISSEKILKIIKETDNLISFGYKQGMFKYTYLEQYIEDEVNRRNSSR